MLFRYELGTKVYFQEENKNYEGTIVERAYIQTYHTPDWDYPEARVASDVVYKVRCSGGSFDFKEHKFGIVVFTDKQEFINQKVIIR